MNHPASIGNGKTPPSIGSLETHGDGALFRVDDARLNILYIDGAARSGSTILARALGAQPGFMTVGEAVLVWRFGVLGDDLCSCGNSFGRCTFWSEVADEAPRLFDPAKARSYVDYLNSVALQSRRLPWLWFPAGRRKIVRDMPPNLIDDIVCLYEAVRKVAKADVVVDSSKFAAYRYLLGLIPDLNLMAIHLVRDPRAVAFSWQRKTATLEELQGDESLHFNNRGFLVAGLDWVLQNFSTDRLNRLDGHDHNRLRYEDFVAQPAHTLQTLVGSAQGITAEKSSAIDLPEVHIFGNPSRFQQGRIEIRLDEEWREVMPRRAQTLVSAIASPLSHKYGYSLHPREARPSAL